MLEQKKLINDKDWDVLVILDACRYDSFRETYKDYLRGDLKKVESPASNTLPWLREISPILGNEKVCYISANPWINSLGVREKYDGRNYFEKIIDVWDFGWDDELGTVPPKEMIETTKRRKNFDGKIIAHFMQPHAPYLSLGALDSRSVKWKFAIGGGAKSVKSKIATFIGKIVQKLFNQKALWKSRKILGIPPSDPLEAVYKLEGNAFLKKAYKDNLKSVLSEFKKLIGSLESKKITITADHGELLGENEKYGHEGYSEHPILRNVPWLEVKK